MKKTLTLTILSILSSALFAAGLELSPTELDVYQKNYAQSFTDLEEETLLPVFEPFMNRDYSVSDIVELTNTPNGFPRLLANIKSRMDAQEFQSWFYDFISLKNLEAHCFTKDTNSHGETIIGIEYFGPTCQSQGIELTMNLFDLLMGLAQESKTNDIETNLSEEFIINTLHTAIGLHIESMLNKQWNIEDFNSLTTVKEIVTSFLEYYGLNNYTILDDQNSPTTLGLRNLLTTVEVAINREFFELADFLIDHNAKVGIMRFECSRKTTFHKDYSCNPDEDICAKHSEAYSACLDKTDGNDALNTADQDLITDPMFKGQTTVPFHAFDINALNEYSQTPLDTAIKADENQYAQWLIKHGAIRANN